MGMEIEDSNIVRIETLKIAEAQYQASGTIYGSTDPVEILNALVSFTGIPFANVHLGLIDEENDPNTINILATGDATGFRAARVPARLQDYPAYEALAAVEVLNIEDVTTDPFLTDAERESLIDQKVAAMLVIPLAVNQRLTGLIVFSYTEQVHFSSTLLRAVRSLADQIAVVFENQSLLRRTAASLDEVGMLYEINRAMLSALDPLDVLRIVRTYTASPNSAIIHVGVEHVPDSSAENITIRHILTASEDQALDRPLVGLNRTTELFDRYETTTVEFFEKLVGKPPSALTLISEGYPAQSAAMIVVREYGIVEDIIVVTYPDEPTILPRRRRLFEALSDQITIVFQNQRLLRDAQKNALQLSRQVRLLQTINQLSSGLSMYRSEKELFDYATQYLVAAMGIDHVGVLMFDRSLETGTLISEYPAQVTIGTKMEIDQSIDLLRQHPDRPVLIQSVEKTDLLPNSSKQVLLKLGVYSMMILPIIIEGKLIGSIGFDIYERGRFFQPDMIDIGQTMVAQLSIALQNIRLYSDAQRRAEQLQQIANFGQLVQGTLNLPDILAALLGEIRQTITADRVSVALLDDRTDQLRVVAQYDEERTYIDVENGPFISTSGTLIGQVWESGEMLVINDTQTSSGIRRAQDLSVRSLMIAPVRSRGRMIGAVNIGAVDAYAYADEDKAIFRQMLTQLVASIENSLAFAASQRIAKNEALINDISIQMQMTNEIQGMMTAAVSELGRALGARRARVRLHVSEG